MWIQRSAASRHFVRACRRRTARHLAKASVARWAALARRPTTAAALRGRQARRAAAAAIGQLRALLALAAARRAAARRVRANSSLRLGRRAFFSWQR